MDLHDEIHVREIRMRCLEVAGQSGAHAGAHKDGPAGAVLEAAEQFADWVMGPAVEVKVVGLAKGVETLL